MSDFLRHLTAPAAAGGSNVLYIQQQNDCLRNDFQALLGDIDAEPAWAVRLFGCLPEAVNLWIGGPESETSFHKDHYENLFAVISGSKTFTLLPPADVFRLAIAEYPVARYEAQGSDLRCCTLELKPQSPEQKVRWCPIDPNDTRRRADYPLFFDPELPECVRVTVNAGEVLYLPSLWHHYVQQAPGPQGVCIAVNMWFDMAMDSKFAHFLLVEKMCGVPGV